LRILSNQDTGNPSGQGNMQVSPPQEEMAADKLMPEVGVPSAPFKAKEALMIRPHYLGKEIRYPLVEFYTRDQSLVEAPAADKVEVENYPTVAKVLAAQDKEDKKQAEKESNIAKLKIESPEEFGFKYKGELHQLAEEHGIGDILGYCFRTKKIDLIGTEKVLHLDYDMKPIHTLDIYPVEET
jgi:hypothetical protein